MSPSEVDAASYKVAVTMDCLPSPQKAVKSPYLNNYGD